MVYKVFWNMENLNIVTFNIRCFGFDGNYFARHRIESRLSTLKDFIAEIYADVDVFILQEIMDLEYLPKIFTPNYKFYFYPHEYPRHMHVVLACRDNLSFELVQTIPNTALDNTQSRPVIYGQLNDEEKPLAHVIGLHLKSGFNHTDKRILQSEQISAFISGLRQDLPFIMGGDFNSHFKSRTEKEFDDLEYLKQIFKNQLELEEHNQKTYVLPTENAQLDHFWTQGLMTKTVEVYDLRTYTEANCLKNYYREISDHLPVKLSIKFVK